jgi:hypothetical protein
MIAWLLLLACSDPVTYIPPETTPDDTATTAGVGPVEGDWCSPSPCADVDRSVCRVIDDAVACLCDDGFLETADGTCEPGECLPNPCDVAGATACVVDGAVASCDCDDDLQRDSWGRCVGDAEDCAGPRDNPVAAWETDGFGVPMAAVVGSDGTTYVPQTERGVVAIQPDGTQPWAPRYDYSAGSPLVLAADGGVLTGDADGVLSVVHPDDGREWWSWTVAGAITSKVGVASDGNVYVGDATGVLTALNAAQELWTREFRAAIDVRPVVGVDDAAFVLAVLDEGAGVTAELYRLDPVDGDVDWRVDEAGLGVPAGSPVATAQGLIAVAAADQVVWFEQTGAEVQRVTLPAAATWEPVDDGAQGLYVVAGTQLCHVGVSEGTLDWCLDSVAAATAPALAQQRHAAFSDADGTLHLVSPDGDRVWALPLSGTLTAAAQGPEGDLRLGSSEGLVWQVAFCGACSQTWCDGDQLMGCREDGAGMQALEDCADSGATCSDGACRVDDYAAEAWRTCGAEDPVWVDSDGVEGATSDTCDDLEHCVSGSCVSCWASQDIGCSDDTVVSVLDECGNPESVVEDCADQGRVCDEGKCVVP